MAVVIVESPAKAKTIEKYLGKDYKVFASYGHVRDLPSKDGSVDTENDFEMKWEVGDDRSKKQLKTIADAVKGTDKLVLATDPDREGEAISWHLLEALYKRRALKKTTPVERVVFNAITKTAVTEAMKQPRDVDMELVEAYLARRALDYLVGFNLSPVLWRKLPGARSAGRVQSVALRLVVEREMEIEAFDAREYWSVKTGFKTPGKDDFEARLTVLDGKKLDKFDLANEKDAQGAVDAIDAREFSVDSIEAKPATRNPSPPFTTSTLQQEASRKLGYGAQQTMRVAQRLYEEGFITYMRTDGVDMAPEAVTDLRSAIGDRYGKEYVPSKPREYKTKQKNAQEAHEAIRPTDPTRLSKDLNVEDDQKKLYDLIWKRTVAAQMESARLERTTAELLSTDKKVGLRATGQVVKFDGFLKVYEEGRDDRGDDDDDSRLLPAMSKGDALTKRGKAFDMPPVKDKGSKDSDEVVVVEKDDSAGAHALLASDASTLALRHFTQPPPRYTEASLVKRMEELGIGRPSTYASIVGRIQDAAYVKKEKNRLSPEDKGRLVTAFLENYFEKYVEYDFTANLEDKLDEISGGRAEWKPLLREFWGGLSKDVEAALELRNYDVLERINEVMGSYLFPKREDGSDGRLCPVCMKEGREGSQLSIKTSARTGQSFIGCSQYPECKFTRAFGTSEGEAAAQAAAGDGKELGIHPPTGGIVWMKSGRWGPYIEVELPEGYVPPEAPEAPQPMPETEAEEDGKKKKKPRKKKPAKPKPPRASIPKGVDADTVDLELALKLLTLPREVGPHPENGEMITAAIGPYGPYVMHTLEGKKTYANMPDWKDALEVGINRAVDLLAEKRANPGKGRGRAAAKPPLKELGEHPKEGGAVNILDGRYGPYVKFGKVNATIPKDVKPEDVTMDMAVEYIEKKRNK